MLRKYKTTMTIEEIKDRINYQCDTDMIDEEAIKAFEDSN